MKKYIYLVTMYRYQNHEGHSYPLGVFEKKHTAMKEAEAEKTYRGGSKYGYEIIELKLNANIREYNKTICGVF